LANRCGEKSQADRIVVGNQDALHGKSLLLTYTECRVRRARSIHRLLEYRLPLGCTTRASPWADPA
jgi:hypothetical protein